MENWGKACFLAAIIFAAGCTSSTNRELIETGGTIAEWKEKILKDIGADSSSYKTAAACEALMIQKTEECSKHQGWAINNQIEITDFSTAEPYSFQDIDEGGCPRKSPDGKEYPVTSEPALLDSQSGGTADSYQVVCEIDCTWWNCKEQATPTSSPKPTPTPAPAVSISFNLDCRQTDKVVRDQITDYFFEITASGTADGPEGSRMQAQANVARTGVLLSTCHYNPFSGQMLSGGISGVSWTVGPSPYEECPNDRSMRQSGQPEQTSWTVKWPYQLEDAYGYMSEDSDIRVKAWIDPLGSAGGLGKIETKTVTCQRG